jgi:hypothetical protein
LNVARKRIVLLAQKVIIPIIILTFIHQSGKRKEKKHFKSLAENAKNVAAQNN